MKTILFFFLCGMTFCLPFQRRPVSEEAVEATQPAFAEAERPAFAGASAGKPDSISFTAQIQPILEKGCNPCHFPGGKMYEKMPFDQAKTVIEHPEGILKRFKDEKENGLIRRFIEDATSSK